MPVRFAHSGSPKVMEVIKQNHTNEGPNNGLRQKMLSSIPIDPLNTEFFTDQIKVKTVEIGRQFNSYKLLQNVREASVD